MFYFAYGTNMDPEGMRERAPGAVPLGAARLPGWRLTFTADEPDAGYGVPHIEPDDKDEVWGVLWELTESDVKRLDEYEGVGLGAYLRDLVIVSHAGQDLEAMVYLAASRVYLKPSAEFVRQIVRGAEAHGLPPAYVDRLRRIV